MSDPLGLAHLHSLWCKAGPALLKAQDDELRNCDVQADLRSLAPLFDRAIADTPPSQTSGLVEWQQCMKLLYGKTSTR